MPDLAKKAWICETAPAKINLNLHVTGRRPDGYHTIESLVVFADCGDRLAARLTPGEDSLGIVGPFGDQISNGSDNLVMQAINRFRKRWPDAVEGAIEVELNKELPVAAGIGGGSSDAAAMLRILSRLSNEPPPLADLLELALDLGADVPVCLQNHPLVMGGVGEKLGPKIQLPAMFGVLVNPGKPVATSEIFLRLEKEENRPLPPIPAQFPAMGALADWLLPTRNDLSAAAIMLVPEIGAITKWLRQNDQCLVARMSGSGATVYALFETEAQAENAALACRLKWPGHWVSQWSFPGGARGAQ